MLDKKDFYDDLSNSYDAMINFNEALERRKTIIEKFLEANTKSAADVGCGTGMDSISLALNKIKVTAFDISPGMIEQAKKNADEKDVAIEFHNYEAKKIPEHFFNNFDLIISFGNTIANIEGEDIIDSFERIYNILKKDGKFIFQILNYQKIINEQERIVNVTGDDKYIYVRFYDIFPDKLNFNILKFDKNNYRERYFSTTELVPLTEDEVSRLLHQIGFKNYEFYGNLNLKEFDENKSSDLVCIAIK